MVETTVGAPDKSMRERESERVGHQAHPTLFDIFANFHPPSEMEFLWKSAALMGASAVVTG